MGLLEKGYDQEVVSSNPLHDLSMTSTRQANGMDALLIVSFVVKIDPDDVINLWSLYASSTIR